ncbi:hypothetical protein SLEP1_g8409 [Rubroshorea leprosula]|uniref:Uncharacterized protein n=1 Tax=Rubroshorea leprosula TaxID=152421 RepID=A0AAV5I643_9ROSI|nr:hypothetical protein SLEP1_g8409 [Rubroshorea leprosula]
MHSTPPFCTPEPHCRQSYPRHTAPYPLHRAYAPAATSSLRSCTMRPNPAPLHSCSLQPCPCLTYRKNNTYLTKSTS